MTRIETRDWDPAAYLAFRDDRLRPALDLIARVAPAEPRRIVDLGCGAGNVTRHLRAVWADATVTGLDSSADMLAKARRDFPDIAWQEGDIADWSPAEPVDLIYANAALHWLDDHENLFPSLFRRLAPGGVLAVQMPRNFGAPSHQLIFETAKAGPWRARLAPLIGWAPVAAPEVYYELLAPLAQSVDIWETEYLHVLEGENPVVAWIKGTGLRPFLEALKEPDRSAFEAAYAARVAIAYARRADGRTLLPFRRLFIVARA